MKKLLNSNLFFINIKVISLEDSNKLLQSKHKFYFIIISMSPIGNPTLALCQIAYLPASLILYLKALLLFSSVAIYSSKPQIACIVLFAVSLLQFLTSLEPKKINASSFFGKSMEDLLELTISTVTLFWWGSMETTLGVLIIPFLSLEVIVVSGDLVARCHGFNSRNNQRLNPLTEVIPLLDAKQNQTKTIGIEYAFHIACFLARIMQLNSGSTFWRSCSLLFLPFCLSYIWKQINRVQSIFQSWQEEHGRGHIALKFKKL